MSITGSLETFSLPELFRLVDAGSKSGQLTVYSSLKNREETYWLWFQNGRLVAVSDRSDCLGLISAIESQGWLKKRVLQRLVESYTSGKPLGSYLKNQSILQVKQLKLLFQGQLFQVQRLFELGSGRFELISYQERNQALPWLEMTGISLRAIDVALFALRRLKNWNSYADQLPQISSALEALVSRPSLQLKALELQLWVLADSRTSLQTITRQVDQSQSEVQQAAYRLMVAGLVEEVPRSQQSSRLLPARPRPLLPETTPSSAIQETVIEKTSVSRSLIRNLISFLRSWF